MDFVYAVYGVSQDPYGHITVLSPKDIVERKESNEQIRADASDYMNTKSKLDDAMKSVIQDISVPVQKAEGQNIGATTGGRLFRVKRSAYRGKYS